RKHREGQAAVLERSESYEAVSYELKNKRSHEKEINENPSYDMTIINLSQNN
ncbi:32526_t:CDS:2, partial [Racocetra persica]